MMTFSTKCLLILPTLLVASNATPPSIFVRPLDVYQNVVKAIHDYFNNTCIIFFYATGDLAKTLEEADQLMSLQKYFSGELHIRTAIMSFEMFKMQVGSSYHHIKRPLFVLLNDHDNARDELAYISTWIAMEYPTWFMFFRKESKIDEFFRQIYVPFHCKFMVSRSEDRGDDERVETIVEIYQVDRESLIRSNTFGTWDRKVGLVAPKLGLFMRRNNLFGRELHAVVMNESPVSVLYESEDNKNTIHVKGIIGGVVNLLQERMNCTMVFTKAKLAGVRQPNGTWNGAIGILERKEADFAAVPLIMMAERLDVIKFTIPLYSSRSRTYIKRPAFNSIKWTAYTAPFDVYIWYCIALLIVLSSATMMLIKVIVKIVPYHRDDMFLNYTFSEIFFYMHGAFCIQGDMGTHISPLDPVRLIQFAIQLTALIVSAAYSAALISSLAVMTINMPFTTMEGLLKDGTYRFGVLSNSADYAVLQNTSDKVLKMLYEKLLIKETDLPISYVHGLTRICQEEKYSFMSLDIMVVETEKNLQCNLEPLDVVMQRTVAMATPLDSPYQGIINTNLLLIRDSGILQRLVNTAWINRYNKPMNNWHSVEFGDTVPLLIFMLTGSIVSCFLLLFECLVTHRSRTNNKSIQIRGKRNGKRMLRCILDKR